MNIITRDEANRMIDNGAWYEGDMIHDRREWSIITCPETQKVYHVFNRYI